jgi:hypothetical protein
MSHRDLEYENKNIGYDWQYTEEDGGGIKCKNYELCDTVLPKWWYDCKGKYLCTTCDIFNWNKLEFRDCPENEDCSVCNESTKQVKFPTNCGHWFCVECSKNVLFDEDETKYHLSPEPYGCPPCPNNCINPVQGEQCDCEEYDEIQENWKINNPSEFKLYEDAHDVIEYNDKNSGSVFGSKTCPLCRKKYE